MATILKIPTAGKGVVVFTTQERDQAIKQDHTLEKGVAALKQRWVVGLHHNWHDHQFEYDPLFDFSMAGEGDLVERSGHEFPLITLDACNFVPRFFAEPGGDRFWDILYIARPVFFKGFTEFFATIRRLYDAGSRSRVLCICPMPPYREEDADTVFYDVVDVYSEMFSEEERQTFTLLTLDYGYPFPLDLETLAHFYRSTKVFAHFAADERRCRVAAYAWTAGRPVVAMEPVGSLLPAELRKPPYFFEARDYETFHESLIDALEAPSDDLDQARNHFLETETVRELIRQLNDRFPDAGLDDDAGCALDQLNIRLGRHHGIGSEGPNTVPMALAALVKLLNDEPRLAEQVADAEDPENALAAATSGGPLQRLARAVTGRR